METKKKILVVDDEEALCDGLGFNLERKAIRLTWRIARRRLLPSTLPPMT